MSYSADELKNVASINKSKLRKKSFHIPIGDNKYLFKISGVGQMSIKIEQYFNYSQIIKAVQNGNTDLEFLIEQIIVDPSKKKIPNLDDSRELRERAFANKQALKRMHINVFVGTKEYDFRIAGIGGRAVKLELYIGYEDIAKELNAGNDVTLEFIIKEILVENEIDYSIFEDIDIEEYNEIDDEEESIEEKFIPINKLSPKESTQIISNIEGIQKLIFDAINEINSDIFTVDDVLEQDILKIYSVQGGAFKQTVVEKINELIDLGIIAEDNGGSYYKLW